MTRKHFIALAEALAAAKPIKGSVPDDGEFEIALGQWDFTVRNVADVCRSFNGLFDRPRFLAAAGVDA